MNFNVDKVWENLRTHRVQVVQELRVDRTLLFDYLRSKAVFDSEDCELVQAEKTNERKASRLLDILQTKATESLEHFLDVVQLLNPGLYEKLTGHKATARENPIISEVSNKSLTDLDPQRDLDILSNHLKRAVLDLQEMTLRYDQLLKENQQLSRKLSTLTGDVDFKSKCLQTTEDQAVKAEERAKEAWNNARKAEEVANIQIKECEKNMNDKHTCLLALLLKLLSSEEEVKQLSTQVEEEKRRNEVLMCKMQELSQNIDNERKTSRKLSEKLSRQQTSIKTVEDLRNRYRELQFTTQKLQMEKDQAISELNELKDWAEALKARYDIVEKNKQLCEENYENVVVDCSQFSKQIQELQFQLSVSRRQESNVRMHNDELIRKVRKYQEQRDFYGEERKKAINERDEARKERDEMYQQFIDVQSEKDKALERFLLETRDFERQHEMDTVEMQNLRESLTQTEEELKVLKIEKELSLSFKPPDSNRSSVEEQRLHNDRDCEDAVDNDGHDDDDDCEVFGNRREALQSYKSRNSTELVKSIKNRFYKTRERLTSLDIPDTDSMVLCAQWLSRLPCQALMPMFYSKTAKSPSGDISAAANGFNLDFDLFLPSSPAKDGDSGVHSPSCNTPMADDLSDAGDLQEKSTKVNCLNDSKDGIVETAYVVDDSIIPKPRQRVYAIDRSGTPRLVQRVSTAS